MILYYPSWKKPGNLGLSQEDVAGMLNHSAKEEKLG